jgi:anti-sigma factor RsiW
VIDERCEQCRELASANADGQLSAPELVRLERHLSACPGCRAFADELPRLRELLQASEIFRPLRRPPAGFAAAVAARAAAQAPGRAVPFPGRRPARRWAAVAAAAAAAALFFAWSWQRLAPTEHGAMVAARGGAAAVAAAEEGSMETYLSEHVQLARGVMPLGAAEEMTFVGYRSEPPTRR